MVTQLKIDARVVKRLETEAKQLLEEYRKNLSLKDDSTSQSLASKFKNITSKTTTKKFKDGSTYEGELNTDGTRHGRGIMYFSNNHIYLGDWSNDLFHGNGVYIFDNYERFNGQLSYGRKNGKGDFFYANGNAII